MMLGEVENVLNWLASDNIEKLDLSDQLKIMMAFGNFIHDIKPIMEKQLEKDKWCKIDWDSFFNNL
mgnify:CR=1 FL=1